MYYKERARELRTSGDGDPEYDFLQQQLKTHIKKTYNVHGSGPEVNSLYRHLFTLSEMKMRTVKLDRACSTRDRVAAKWAAQHSELPNWALRAKAKAYKDALEERMEYQGTIIEILCNEI
jgi:hypothetical protein